MAICKRCGANDLLTSDLCGNAGCIYCYGTSIEELKETEDKYKETEKTKKYKIITCKSRRNQ